jgi:hypothetical protein
VIRSWRGAVPVGVYVTLHVADAVVPESVQVPVNVPVWLVENVTVPLGEMNVPGEVSATVILHVDPTLMSTGEVQLTVVVVTRLFTVIVLDVVGPLPA